MRAHLWITSSTFSSLSVRSTAKQKKRLAYLLYTICKKSRLVHNLKKKIPLAKTIRKKTQFAKKNSCTQFAKKCLFYTICKISLLYSICKKNTSFEQFAKESFIHILQKNTSCTQSMVFTWLLMTLFKICYPTCRSLYSMKLHILGFLRIDIACLLVLIPKRCLQLVGIRNVLALITSHEDQGPVRSPPQPNPTLPKLDSPE